MVHSFEPSFFFAKIVGRSTIMTEILGSALSMQFRSQLHCKAHGLAPMPQAEAAVDMVRQELLDARAELSRLKAAGAAGGCAFITPCAPLVEDERNATQSIQKERMKNDMVAWVLTNKINFKNAPLTLLGAEQLISSLSDLGGNSILGLVDAVLKDQGVRRQAVYLDDALDKLLAQQLATVVLHKCLIPYCTNALSHAPYAYHTYSSGSVRTYHINMTFDITYSSGSFRTYHINMTFDIIGCSRT
jgi:hypothetical protein